MLEVFFLSSMDSKRFSSVFRCTVERPIELPNGHHALMVSCDPPLNGQELGQPLGIGELLLWSRFEDEDIWTSPLSRTSCRSACLTRTCVSMPCPRASHGARSTRPKQTRTPMR